MSEFDPLESVARGRHLETDVVPPKLEYPFRRTAPLTYICSTWQVCAVRKHVELVIFKTTTDGSRAIHSRNDRSKPKREDINRARGHSRRRGNADRFRAPAPAPPRYWNMPRFPAHRPARLSQTERRCAVRRRFVGALVDALRDDISHDKMRIGRARVDDVVKRRALGPRVPRVVDMLH